MTRVPMPSPRGTNHERLFASPTMAYDSAATELDEHQRKERGEKAALAIAKIEKLLEGAQLSDQQRTELHQLLEMLAGGPMASGEPLDSSDIVAPRSGSPEEKAMDALPPALRAQARAALAAGRGARERAWGQAEASFRARHPNVARIKRI
jgi:hypothetical protein